MKLYNFDRCVADTNAIISYFGSLFEQPQCLSDSAHVLLRNAIENIAPIVPVSILSVTMIEIFEKWLRTEEFARQFYYEVLTPLRQSPNIEFREVDREIIENLITIHGLDNHEVNDKLILASAISLGCPLITSDTVVRDFVASTNIIPQTIS